MIQSRPCYIKDDLVLWCSLTVAYTSVYCIGRTKDGYEMHFQVRTASVLVALELAWFGMLLCYCNFE